jgi:hypothetical protein
MHKATITGTLAMLAAAVLVSGGAQAGGGSMSAPSKYAHANRIASENQVLTNRQAQSTNFAITEYSSSSARNPSRRHAR